MLNCQAGKMTACGGLRKNRRESAESPPPVSELQYNSMNAQLL